MSTDRFTLVWRLQVELILVMHGQSAIPIILVKELELVFLWHEEFTVTATIGFLVIVINLDLPILLAEVNARVFERTTPRPKL